MTHNINHPQESTASRPSRPNTPNSSREPQIPRTALPPTSSEQKTSNQTSEIATQNVQREILVKILEQWVHDTTATGNKTEATNKILECFTSRSISLKLNNLEINKLPDFLRFLPDLKNLDLSDNKITNFPIERDSLNDLLYLNLSNNQITHLTIPINSLSSLRKLRLSGNQITDFIISTGSLNNLEKLNLSDQKLKNLSIPHNSLNRLQRLDLSNNEIEKFSSIPSNSLPNLRELILSNNKITDFPISSGSLTNLQELYLAGNLITDFPIPSNCLTNLQILSLGRNLITDFPISSDSLTNLQELYLEGNLITDFPIPSGSFPNLQELRLSRNLITGFSIPSDSLNNLQHLFLSNNEQLTNISMTSPLNHLCQLFVGNNPNLHELPLLLGRSPSLTNIDTDSSSPQLQRSATAILEATELSRCSASREKLPAELTLWKRYAEDPEMDITKVLNALTPDNQGTVYEWLVRLSQSADFKSNQRNLASVVCLILKDLTNEDIANQDFKQMALSQMSANNEACQDRASMALNELYLSWALLCGNSNLSPKERLTMIAKAGRTLALREAITNQLAGRPDIAESVETYLYYETHLADSLELLTCIKDMSYPHCAKPLDEQKLRDYVEEHYLKKAAEIPNLEEIMQEDPEGRAKIHEIKVKAMRASSSLLEARPENVSEESPEMLEWTIRYNQLKQTRDKEIQDFRVAWLQERLSKRS